jgi:Neutral trehalase
MHVNSWGSHDVGYLNAVMKIPQLAEVRVSLYDDSNKVHVKDFLWSNMKRLGLHGTDGEYFSIDLFYRDFVFNLEFGGEGDIFVYKVTPGSVDKAIKFCVAGILRWGREGSVSVSEKGITIETAGQKDLITVVGERDRITYVNAVHAGLLMESSSPVYIRCNHEMDPLKMENFLKTKREKAEAAQVKSGGMLYDSCEAITKGLLWNTFYEPSLESVITVISRQWCSGFYQTLFGSYILADWDTFFASVLGGIQDRELAYNMVYNITGQVTERGFIPNVGSQRGKSGDRSQPPVGAYCIYKLYRQFGEKKLLENTFDLLLRWHKWWWKYRDGNRDGLLEWGSDYNSESDRLGYGSHDIVSARLETGLDNSPMYDDVVFNNDTNTMELMDVGLNALFAMDAWALAEIASELGRADAASDLRAEYICLKRDINAALWNEEKGIYLNRYWDGRFSYSMSPTCFYPMIAGIASEEQARRMVEEHLLNPEEFWGEYVIPSISRNDKAFYDNEYWRGRIWGPMNFLVSEGLKRYSFYEVANAFAEKSLKLFRKEWTEKGHIHENYNAITGEGDDVRASDPLYHWGALLAFAAVSEVVEVQPWEGLRFGNLSPETNSVENYPYGKDLYSVFTGNGIKVYRNGELLLESADNLIITGYRVENSTLKFRLTAGKSVKLVLHDLQNVRNVTLQYGEQIIDYIVEGNSIIVDTSVKC